MLTALRRRTIRLASQDEALRGFLLRLLAAGNTDPEMDRKVKDVLKAAGLGTTYQKGKDRGGFYYKVPLDVGDDSKKANDLRRKVMSKTGPHTVELERVS